MKTRGLWILFVVLVTVFLTARTVLANETTVFEPLSHRSALAAPTLTVTTSGTTVTASWTTITGATGYTLYYAPYPNIDYIESANMGNKTNYSINLMDGAAFYVAIKSYNSSGISGYSNIEHFVIGSSFSLNYSVDITRSAPRSTEFENLYNYYGIVPYEGHSTNGKIYIEMTVIGNDSQSFKIKFKDEVIERNIQDHISNLTAKNEHGINLNIINTSSGVWQIQPTSDTVIVSYYIDKQIKYIWSWDFQFAGNDYAVYINDNLGFFAAPYLFLYPVSMEGYVTEPDSISLFFTVPDGWKVVTPFIPFDNHFEVRQHSRSLLSSFINTAQFYMGRMLYYAEATTQSGCRVTFGIPYGCEDPLVFNFSQSKVDNYVQATASVLDALADLFGENPFSIYTMHTTKIDENGSQITFPGNLYFGNGMQYWPLSARSHELTDHMWQSFMEDSGVSDPLVLSEVEVEKGLGKMFYGHKLAYDLFGDASTLAMMYYWWLVYERMHGTSLTEFNEYSEYVKSHWASYLLNKRIKEVSGGNFSLDEVIRSLSSQYKRTSHVIVWEDVKTVSEQLTGADFSEIFTKYVFGDEKIPLSEDLNEYKDEFQNIMPSHIQDYHFCQTNGYVVPLFILIEMTVQLGGHIHAGLLYLGYLDQFVNHVRSLYSITSLSEQQVVDSLSALTGKDCSGFFDRWSASFGRLSISEIRSWVESYN